MVINKAAAAEREEELGKALRRVAGGRDSGERGRGRKGTVASISVGSEMKEAKFLRKKSCAVFAPASQLKRGTGK